MDRGQAEELHCLPEIGGLCSRNETPPREDPMISSLLWKAEFGSSIEGTGERGGSEEGRRFGGIARTGC